MDNTILNSLWMIICILLVLVMIPGLAFFYAGLTRAKHSVNTMFMSFIVMGPLCLLWLILGFSLVFSNSFSGIIGNFNYLGLQNLPKMFSGVPSVIFVLFQMAFSFIACAIISGAIIERTRHKFWMYFSVLWTLFVYYPVAHWVWAQGGWIEELGGKDFAGGLVVHISSGASAFILAKSLGRRLDFFKLKKSYNLGFVFLGSALLWIGWFGFNAGSALAFDSVAVNSVVTTLVASLTAMLAWYFMDMVFTPHKPTTKGINIALICGLVGITPSAGYVGLWDSALIGLIVAFVCNIGVRYFHSVVKVDDALDVFISHGLCGFVGALLTGVFAHNAVNGSIDNGIIYGGSWSIFNANLIGSIIVMIYSMIVTKILYIIIDKFIAQARLDQSEEEIGSDISIHGEHVLIIKNDMEY
jgi:Amt family ammonium transporter